ncbi:MAG: putative toxin-antitoxin system toxin component, PIN family [Anaerolineae bacterium]
MPDSAIAPVRAVVDVNLLVRGILSSKGGSATLIHALKQGMFVPIASRPYLQEIYRVLGYPRLLRRYPISDKQRQRLIAQIYNRAIWVEPANRLNLCRDPHDDYLLEMALLGRASYLVSEDGDLQDDLDIILFLAQRGIHLLRLGGFLAVLRRNEIPGNQL